MEEIGNEANEWPSIDSEPLARMIKFPVEMVEQAWQCRGGNYEK